MSNPTDPQTSTATTPTVAATDVTVAGQHFELKGLSVADGDKLYRALPADYQKLADQYAAIAKNFERVSSVQLPRGMTLKQALENYKNALIAGAGKLTGNPEPYLQQLDATCRSIPGYATVVDSAANAKNGYDLAGTAVGAFTDTLTSPVRFLSFLGTTLTEGVGALTPGISDAQAHAFGAAYAAALYHEGAVRQTMTTSQMIWNHPVEASLAGLDNLVLNVPILKDAWPYIYAAWKWVSGAVVHFGDTTTKAPTFAEALTQAQTEIEAARTQNPDWRSNVESRVRAGDVDAASAIMAQAQTVAGISTQPIADAVKDDKTIIDKNGNLAAISTQGGNATIETDTTQGANGQTRGDRIGQAAYDVLGNSGKALVSGQLSSNAVAAIGVGGAGALWAANKVVPGGLRNIPGVVGGATQGAMRTGSNALRGLGAGYLQGSAETIATLDEGKIFGNSFSQANGGLNRLDRLQLQEQQAAERARELAARGEKGGWGLADRFSKIKSMAAENKWKKVAEKVAELEEQLGKSPAFRGTALASDALKVSDAATEVAGASGASRIGQLTRSGGRLLGRFAPWLTAGFAAKDTYDGVQELGKGETRAATESFSSAGTVATGAIAGGTIGAAFFGIGAIPGAAIGAGVAGAADFVGGLFGYGSRDIAGKVYDSINPNEQAQKLQQAQAAARQAELKQIAADPEIQEFVRAVQARDPEALRLLMGNDQVAKNAKLALQASGVQIGSVIPEGALAGAATTGGAMRMTGAMRQTAMNA